MKTKNKQKYLVLSLLSILSFALITAGVTYSFFNYIGRGETENTIEAGSISFIYEEVNKMGNGIKIEDALPMSDTEGKESTDYFDFKVTATTAATIDVPYEITARVIEGSDDISEYVKVYLTKVNGNSEEEKILSIYSDLDDSTNALAAMHGDKTLYKGEIPIGVANYTENYRLRMWLNNDPNDGSVIDYSPVYACSDTQYTNKDTCEINNNVWVPTGEYNNQNKTFSIKINVYANGEQATTEKITSATTTGITGIRVNGTDAEENTDTSLNYDYFVETPSEETNEMEIITLNDGQTYTIENITSEQATALRQVSTKQTINLVANADNYFKVTVTSSNKQNSKVYVVKVHAAAPLLTLGEEIFEKYPLSTVKTNPSLTRTTAVSGESGFYKFENITNGFGGQTEEGTTYYFRGNVTNNYVSFAGMLWRIVRINEDGTYRLILDDRIVDGTTKDFYFNANKTTINDMYYSTGTSTTSAQYILNRWFTQNIDVYINGNSGAKYSDKVASGRYFCEQAKVAYDSAAKTGSTVSDMQIYNATGYQTNLSCVNDSNGHGIVPLNSSMPFSQSVGLMTYEEWNLAGGYGNEYNTSYYLYKGVADNKYKWWLMSPWGFKSGNIAYSWMSNANVGSGLTYVVNSKYSLRPVINLKADVKVSGLGTSSSPWVVQ